MASVAVFKLADIRFNTALTFFFLFVQLETFFFFCYHSVLYSTKFYKLTPPYNALLTIEPVNKSYYFYFFLFFIFLKNLYSPYIPLCLMLTFFFYKLDSQSTNFIGGLTTVLIPNILLFIFSLFFFIKSFLTLFFFIEFFSVVYYFFFLTNYRFLPAELLRYKNGLLLLIWNNYLTMCFMALSCYFLIKLGGTTNFYELNLIKIHSVAIYTFLAGFFWKLGVPLFHFLKLEVYKYLTGENIFYFSTITTLINITLLFFVISQHIIFDTLYQHNLFIIIFIISVCLTVSNLTLTNFLYFLSLSSILTMVVILTVLLI